MTGASTAHDVSLLEEMNLQELRDCWRALYGAPPSLRSPELLRLMLGWRIQAEASGGLTASSRRALRRPSGQGTSPSVLPGVRLVRDWKGQRHEAMALEDGGFTYGGERFDSLSMVARRITGTRWNGPRFFGLRDVGQ